MRSILPGKYVIADGVSSVVGAPPLQARDIVRVTIAMAVVAASRALSALAMRIVPPHLRPQVVVLSRVAQEDESEADHGADRLH